MPATTATTTIVLPRALPEAAVAHLANLITTALTAERANEREWGARTLDAVANVKTKADTDATEATRHAAVDDLWMAVYSLTDYDLETCDNCAATYSPEARADRHEDCPGGHCADEACACQACHR